MHDYYLPFFMAHFCILFVFESVVVLMLIYIMLLRKEEVGGSC